MATVSIPLPNGLKSAKWKRAKDSKDVANEMIAALEALEKCYDVADWDAIAINIPKAFDDQEKEDEDSGEKDKKKKDKKAFADNTPLGRLAAAVDEDLIALAAQAKTLSQIAGKAEDKLKKESSRKAEYDLAKAASRDADWLLKTVLEIIRSVKKELEEQTKKRDKSGTVNVGKKGGLKNSPDLNVVRSRVKDALRTIKTKNQPMKLLLVTGHRFCIPYVSDRELTKSRIWNLMRFDDGTKEGTQDTGPKYYEGEVRWEDGAYTFIAPGFTSSFKNRIETGLRELTETRVRVRAIPPPKAEPAVKGKDKDKGRDKGDDEEEA
jgi:hypothetical protein